ncbi:MAG: hypothetical protein M1436_01570 [Acidobacteria bacterium]|nr:hypothetical protein [Acidobacteriota bacterium]
MRVSACILSLVLAAGFATAQRQKLEINAETPEGQLLQQIGQESDEAKKIGLLEQFAAKYPKHEGIGWVYAQMVPAYSKAGQFDKAMDAGDKLLAIDPEDVEMGHACLKAAEAKKDPDAVVKWANKTSAAARKVAASPQPKDADEVEDWKRTVDYAKQVDIYTEYSIYAMALQTPDPKRKLALADALEQQNPQSQYLPQLAEQRFMAYVQAGETPKAIALAEKLIAQGQGSEDMMLAVADGLRSQKGEPDKIIAMCTKAMELANSKPKPQGVADADWDKRKTQISGRANYMMGVTYAAQTKWAQTDEALRAALPGIRDDQRMTAEALFYLGVANFRMGEQGQLERIKDAVRYNEQCAAIPGPFQAPARNNLKAIRAQYRIQ